MNKRVGTVMEWLPNGSLNDLLGNITHEDMTLQAAVDATAWSRSRRASAPATPAHLAGLRVADVFTMPCCSNTLQELGGDAWVRRPRCRDVPLDRDGTKDATGSRSCIAAPALVLSVLPASVREGPI